MHKPVLKILEFLDYTSRLSSHRIDQKYLLDNYRKRSSRDPLFADRMFRTDSRRRSCRWLLEHRPLRAYIERWVSTPEQPCPSTNYIADPIDKTLNLPNNSADLLAALLGKKPCSTLQLDRIHFCDFHPDIMPELQEMAQERGLIAAPYFADADFVAVGEPKVVRQIVKLRTCDDEALLEEFGVLNNKGWMIVDKIKLDGKIAALLGYHPDAIKEFVERNYPEEKQPAVRPVARLSQVSKEDTNFRKQLPARFRLKVEK